MKRTGFIPNRPQGYGDPIAAYCTGRDRHTCMLQHLADMEAAMFAAAPAHGMVVLVGINGTLAPEGAR